MQEMFQGYIATFSDAEHSDACLWGLAALYRLMLCVLYLSMTHQCCKSGDTVDVWLWVLPRICCLTNVWHDAFASGLVMEDLDLDTIIHSSTYLIETEIPEVSVNLISESSVMFSDDVIRTFLFPAKLWSSQQETKWLNNPPPLSLSLSIHLWDSPTALWPNWPTEL